MFITMARKKSPKVDAKFVRVFIVEGYTEEHYINRLKKIFKSPDKVINCKGGGAKSVLNKAKKTIDEGNYSEYVVVYDKDADNTNNDGLRAKIRNKSDLVILAPCFEMWLLCHFENRPAYLHCKDYIDCIKEKYIKNYEKNNAQVFECINEEKFLTAIRNNEEIGNKFKKYFKPEEQIKKE